MLRQEQPPRFAVVRLRKRNEWVLPKGKLDDGETPRAAAEREVIEETGHAVSVHEFLGTLVYWRMEAGGGPVRELMRDVKAVDWLPLDRAVKRLSRGHERTFLENVGPLALQAANNVVEADGSAKVAFEPREIVVVDDEVQIPGKNFVQKIRDWLRRAA